MLSLPKIITPNYQDKIPDVNTYTRFLFDQSIGSKIKDLPAGETAAYKIFQENKVRMEAHHSVATHQYQQEHSKLLQRAEVASFHIRDVRMKQWMVAAVVVTNIMAVFTVSIWFLPFLLPTGYCSQTLFDRASQLQTEIDAPANLHKPVLQLPFYNPKMDLELRDTRIEACNAVALMSLEQLAKTCCWTNQQILDFDLFGKISQRDKNYFYGKRFEIIRAYREIEKQHFADRLEVDVEFNKLMGELNQWNRKSENGNISLKHRTNYEIVNSGFGGPSIRKTSGLAVVVDEESLFDTFRRCNTYTERDRAIRQWKKETIARIDSEYNRCISVLQARFDERG